MNMNAPRRARSFFGLCAGVMLWACGLAAQDNFDGTWWQTHESLHSPVLGAAGEKAVAASGAKSVWVFMVGVLSWEDGGNFASFDAAGRKDIELARFFSDRLGVPPDHIVFLQDAAARKAVLEKWFVDLISRAQKGDTLFFYYAGRGVREKPGMTYFMPYDAVGGNLAQTGWPIPAIFDAIETYFQGARAIITADCSYGVLAASQSGVPALGRWTFTESLLQGLKGSSLADSDGDGQILFHELAQYIESQTAFLAEQLSDNTTTGDFNSSMKIADVTERAPADVGTRVFVKFKDENAAPAEIRQIKGQEVLVRYQDGSSLPDGWVSREQLRRYTPVPVRWPEGTAVQVEWQGNWHPARILNYREGLHLIHYEGFGDYWDEWVASRRIKPAS